MDGIMDTLQTTVVTPLQPLLRPITTALPLPVHDVITRLIGPSCHNALLLNLDVTESPECTALALSKALGIAIVGASAIVKVPQILKLVRSGSSAGVSFVSYALETASLLISMSYSVRNRFPFSTYGESALIGVQDVVVGVLVLGLAGRPAAAAAFVAVFATSVYVLLVDSTLVDSRVLAYLQAGAGALSIASKAPQIYTIWCEGSTGQLSAFAVFNYLLGSLSRIFTTLQEVNDKIVLYGFVAGFSLNLILAGQMLYYWNAPTTTTKAKHHAKETNKTVPVAAKTPTAQSTGVTSKSSAKAPTTRRRG